MREEDKPAIVAALLPVLQMTRQYHDLVDLKYEAEMGNLGLPVNETVTAIFINGKKTANVTMDSGAAMLQDIMEQIW